MATLPANLALMRDVPTIGFIAHMDTSPDASGKHVKASIVKAEERDYIDARYKGQDVIVTDTTTLLGADDKAGIAEIVTAMEYLVQHPEIKHGKVRVGFTPDEEIGQGADHFLGQRMVGMFHRKGDSLPVVLKHLLTLQDMMV